MDPSFHWKARFIRDFVQGDIANMPPFAVSVDVTNRCNLDCLHCRIHSPQAGTHRDSEAVSDFPLDRFLGLCSEARLWGIRKIVLIGEGEPLLHPELPEMIAAAKEARSYTILLTNGTLLSKRAKDLLRSGLDELRVSLWVTDAGEYRSMYPGSGPNNFYRTIEGLHSMVALKRASHRNTPRIVLHRPIEPRLLPTVDRTVDLARETGCDSVSFSVIKPLIPCDEDRVIKTGEVHRVLQTLPHLRKRAREAGMSDNTREVRSRLNIGRAVWEEFPCYIGWIDMRIRTNGDVVPCDTCNWVMGNVHDAELREIWNHTGYQEFRSVARDRKGIPASGRNCRCDYCCHAITNSRLHRRMMWFSPLANFRRKRPV